MKANDILLLALKHKVKAIARSDGHFIWCAELPGGRFGSSGDFITLACDDTSVFAYCAGYLHCLELSSGRLLWTSELPGHGVGLASQYVPGYTSATDNAAVKHVIAQQDAAAASSATIAET